MGAARVVCAALLVVAVCAKTDREESAQLLKDVNGALDDKSSTSPKASRSLFYHGLEDPSPAHAYGSPYVPEHRISVYEPPEYRGTPFYEGVKYAPKFQKYMNHYPKIAVHPKPYEPKYKPYIPVYKPHVPKYDSYVPKHRPAEYEETTHTTDFSHSSSPFYEAQQKIKAQFTPESLEDLRKAPLVHHKPSLEQYAKVNYAKPIYRPKPEPYFFPTRRPYYPTPKPYRTAHVKPEPYAHHFGYSAPTQPEHSMPFPRPKPSPMLNYDYLGGREAKALDPYGFDPSPFIETIAVAYHENEKSFGQRRGRSYQHTAYEKPLESRPYFTAHKPSQQRHTDYKPKYRSPYTPEYRSDNTLEHTPFAAPPRFPSVKIAQFLSPFDSVAPAESVQNAVVTKPRLFTKSSHPSPLAAKSAHKVPTRPRLIAETFSWPAMLQNEETTTDSAATLYSLATAQSQNIETFMAPNKPIAKVAKQVSPVKSAEVTRVKEMNSGDLEMVQSMELMKKKS